MDKEAVRRAQQDVFRDQGGALRQGGQGEYLSFKLPYKSSGICRAVHRDIMVYPGKVVFVVPGMERSR